MPEYRNPNQTGGGSADGSRSTLVMMIVMIGVIVGLQFWRSKHNPTTAAPSNIAAVSQPAAGSAPPAASRAPSAPAASAAAPDAPASPTASVQAAAEATTVVENELYKITFTNKGAQVSSWILKRYKDSEGKPLDLVHAGASELYGYPLSLYTYDPALTKTLAGALYVPSATGSLQSPATLTFKYAGNGLEVTKTFTFGADYVIHADTQVLRNGQPVAALVSWPAAFGDMENAQAYSSANVDTSSSGKTEHIAFKKVSGGATLNPPFDYAGLSDQYFGAVFLPDNPNNATLVTLSNKIDVNKVHRSGTQGASPTNSKPVEVPVLGAALGSKDGHVQTRLFVGPKDWQVLRGVKSVSGESISGTLDFGFWGPVSEGLFLGLRAVHTWIAPAHPQPGNYSWGWAIVLFTFLIYAILLPLRYQGMKGMLKMQRIQPQIDAIKAKHGNPGATDSKAGAMNAEIMAFQKSQGVSMLGGCIPTVVQFPLLFAFFTMMTKVVELRQAHWFWLHDLSAPDPYRILPIVMVLTSFLVQFYTPSPGVDPAQQRMMAFMMPAFSGWMTWNYASGLALYWNIGNFVMVFQQLLMNRTAIGREMRQLQLDKAKRNTVKRGKAASAPRTIQGKR